MRFTYDTSGLLEVDVLAHSTGLRRRYGEFLLHGGVVGRHFDPVRIEAVASLLTSRPVKPLRVSRVVGGYLTFFIVVTIARTSASPSNPAVAGVIVLGMSLLILPRRWTRRLWHRPRRH